jgi:hypothetical protein
VTKKTIIFPVLILFVFGLIRSFAPLIGNLQIEDLQTAFFPIFLASLWWCLRKEKSSKFTLAVLFLLFLWTLSASNVRGFGASFLKKDRIYLARFPKDVNSVSGSNFSFYYYRVADHYRAPQMQVVQRDFSNPVEAENWLNQRDFEKILITPDEQWGRIYLANNFLLFGKKSELKPNSELLKISKSLSLDMDNDLYLLKLKGNSWPLAMAVHPTQLQLPMAPEELLAIFISLFSKAVSSDSLGIRSEYFTRASDVVGPWLTNGPRSMSAYYSATIDLFRAVNEPAGKADLNCVLQKFGHASGLNQGNGYLLSGIYNNLAIAYLLADEDEQNLSLAKDLLVKAASAYDRENQPYVNTKIALLNLMILDRMGL